MTFELLAHLAGPHPNAKAHPASDLLGLADECLAGSRKNRSDAQRWYRERAARVRPELPERLLLARTPAPLLPGWLVVEIRFTLEAPWHSKDDRPLHVLDNPVRKDRVFGVPFMAAASWKGLLRWACRMEEGLFDHLAEHGKEPDPMERWPEPDWIVHLFGNVKVEDELFSRGALQCFPSWFDRIGFEVINPHDRERRAGTNPIPYEVVPPGTKSALRLLYAPSPGLAEKTRVRAPDAIRRLLDAAHALLTRHGFSAKRTAGWGIATIESVQARSTTRSLAGDLAEVRARVSELLGSGGRPT